MSTARSDRIIDGCTVGVVLAVMLPLVILAAVIFGPKRAHEMLEGIKRGIAEKFPLDEEARG